MPEDHPNDSERILNGPDSLDPNISPINIENEMRKSYLDYAMSVIVGRAPA